MGIFDRFPQIYCVDADDQNELMERLEALDVRCFVMDGSLISDTESFYAEAARTLPLDPPLKGTPRNWDAFEDSLWEGLANLEHSKVAFIWSDADRIADTALPQLMEICIVMNDVIRSVSQESSGIAVPVSLAMILLGTGHSFAGVEEVLQV